jgi:hypothetical protein
MAKFLKGFNFFYWVFMLAVSILYIAIDIPINPVNFMLMAICGLFEHMNNAT